MRGIYSNKTKIRHTVFAEVAKMAYEDGDLSRIEKLPYEILPGEIGSYRNNIFLERAIIGERLRATVGLSVRTMAEHAPLSEGVDEAEMDAAYYQPPLLNIIKFACHSCPEKQVLVTNACQGCLEHPCVEVCGKDAIHMVNGHSQIDPEKCVSCGKCVNACPYGAIVKLERPCAKACGVNAIRTDAYGRAEIDKDKCVSCGQCLVSCPFSAIVDKSQIFQTILALKSETPVYAVVAPSFVNQFGQDSDLEHVRAGLKALGFEEMVEVAVGADLCALQEAEDFLKEVPEKIPFMGTSCCPAWSSMAKKQFPQYKDCISMALTPMVLTARMVKRDHPECKVAFIGPCAAKKLEARRKSIRSDVDYVLTFEELSGMFEAKGVEIGQLETEPVKETSSADGKGFAKSGGVANAVVDVLKKLAPNREVKIVSAEGLAECKKMMMMAKAGKYNGYLLEGMACPGGCIGGAGVLGEVKKTEAALEKMKKASVMKEATETAYSDYLNLIAER